MTTIRYSWGDYTVVLTLLVASLALTLSVVVGCFDDPPDYRPRTQTEIEVYTAAEEGWIMAGLPDPGMCLYGASITWVPEDKLKHICGPAAQQCWLGLTKEAVLADGADPSDAIHEAMHALYRCVLYEEEVLMCADAPAIVQQEDPVCYCEVYEPDVYDYCHADSRVWRDYPSYNPRSAQALAEKIYMLRDGGVAYER